MDIPRAAIEAHLKACVACAVEYKKYSQLLDDVRNLPEPEMPWGFHESLMDYVEARTAKKKWSFFRGVPQWAAIAASLVALFMWGLVAFSTTETGGHFAGDIPIAPFDAENFVPIAPAMEALPPMTRAIDEGDDQTIAPIVETDHENWLRRRFNIARAVVLSLGAASLWGVAISTLRKPSKGLK